MPHDTAHPQPAGGSGGSPRSTRVLLIVFGGLALSVSSFLSLARGDYLEAIYTGVGVAAFVVLGLIWAVRAGRDATNDRPRYTWRSIVVAGVVIGVGVLVCAIQLWRTRPPVDNADVAGVAEPGDYRNHLFGFRVRYGPEWQDVSVGARKLAAERNKAGTDNSGVLLALVRPPIEQNDRAGLTIMANPLPPAERITSGADYLTRMLSLLQQRPDAPREIRQEPQMKIGGSTYDRVALKRPQGEGEIAMTYWVAVKRGYAVVMTGVYDGPEGLRAIESLLSSVSEDVEK